MDITELTTKYIALRDRKAEMKKKHEGQLAPIVHAMEVAEAALMAWFNEHNMDSVGCGAGTAYRAKRTSATVADREAFFAWVIENDAMHMLESRAAKTQIDEYVEKSGGDLPPGIKYTVDQTINVRRS